MSNVKPQIIAGRRSQQDWCRKTDQLVTILDKMGVVSVHTDRPFRLKNPPIVEAAIGITVSKLPDSTLEKLKDLAATTVTGWNYGTPQKVTQNSFEMKVVDGQSTAVTRDEPLGWQCDSADKLYRVQFKLDGFAFSRLGKYDTWESFTAEAKKLWNMYFSAIGPIEVSAYGVRYINKVFIPEGVNVAQYLRVYPKEPEDENWHITESLMRIGMQIFEPQEGMFIHHHVLVPSDRPDFVAVILDNDFRYQTQGLAESDLWERIDAVRPVKDDYFRLLITDKLLETFNV
jgi:uncharacterized protein (TIGR04255 family)